MGPLATLDAHPRYALCSYAPFCKHVFVPNFVGAKVAVLPIGDKTLPFLRFPLCRTVPYFAF